METSEEKEYCAPGLATSAICEKEMDIVISLAIRRSRLSPQQAVRMKTYPCAIMDFPLKDVQKL
jgi:hypothetical protein